VARTILKDLLLSAFVGFLAAESPLTPSGVGGRYAFSFWLAAIAFFAYRRYRAWIAEDSETEGPIVELSPLAWLCLAAVVVVFAPTFSWMYKYWTYSVWQNNHGLLMPVLMFFLARPVFQYADLEDGASAWGFLFLGVGLACVVTDAAIQTGYVASLGLAISLPGLSLLFLGKQRTHALRVALVMGLFMLPLPNSFANHLYMRNVSAAIVAEILQWMSIPTLRDNTILHLPDHTFVVSTACSGFATFYAGVALSIFLACYCESPLRRAALLLSIVPLTLATNVLRLLLLIQMAYSGGGNLLDSPLHTGTGIASFGLVLLAIYVIAGRQTMRNSFR